MSGSTSAPAPAQTVSVGQVLHALRRRWTTLVAGALLGGGLAGAYSAVQPPQYEATAVVTLNALMDNPLSTTGTPRLPNTATETEVLRSSEVAERVSDSLGGVSPVEVLKRVSVTAPVDSQALRVSYTASDPLAAAAGADAFAASYLEYRSDVLEDQVDTLRSELTTQLRDLEVDQLAAQSLALTAASDVERARAAVQLESTTTLVDRANEQLAQLRTAPTVTGVLVGPAAVPTGPAGPALPVLLAAGILVGLLLGAVWALVRDRLDHRVTGRSQLEDRLDRPVLAELAASLAAGPAAGPDRAAYQRLAALLAAGGGGTGRGADPAASVLVTRAYGDSPTPTAALLALGLAQQGRSTTLWCSPTALAANRALVSSVQSRVGRPQDGRSAVRVECFGAEEQLAARPDVLGALRSESTVTVVDGSDVTHWATPLVLAGAVSSVVLVARSGVSTLDDVRRSLADLACAGGEVAGLVLLSDRRHLRRPRAAAPTPVSPPKSSSPSKSSDVEAKATVGPSAAPGAGTLPAAPAPSDAVRRSTVPGEPVRVPNG